MTTPTTNTERRDYLQDLLANRAHQLHQDIYALTAAARDDAHVSRALEASLVTACAAVTVLANALSTAIELLHEPTAAR